MVGRYGRWHGRSPEKALFKVKACFTKCLRLYDLGMAEVTQDQISAQREASATTFVWHELYVPNLEEGVKFYTEALGMGSHSMDMGEMGSYTMLTKNGIPVCGMQSTDNPHMAGVPPHWAVYMGVDDVDASIAKCEAAGGKVVVPPMDIPTVGRMALIHDQQGAHLWLFTPSPRS